MMGRSIKKVGELPFEESKAFALLSSFFPDHEGQDTDTFVAKVKASDPRDIIARAESLTEKDLVAGQRELFERVLAIVQKQMATLHE